MEWEVEELYKLGKIQPEILEAALRELWLQHLKSLFKPNNDLFLINLLC